jgi:hypothetical protein
MITSELRGVECNRFAVERFGLAEPFLLPQNACQIAEARQVTRAPKRWPRSIAAAIAASLPAAPSVTASMEAQVITDS